MIELERRYRVIADVDVSLDASGAGDLERRLLHALFGDEVALDAWLGREAMRHVLDHGLDDFAIDTPEEALLRPVIATLEPPARRFFEEAIGRDAFCESADAFLDATSAKILAVGVSGGRSSQHGPEPVRFRCRVLVDALAQVRRIRTADAEESWHWMMRRCVVDPTVSPESYSRFQRALLQALLKRWTELDLWLKQEVMSELIGFLEDPFTGLASDESILAPVASSLPPPERDRIQKALAEGRLEGVAPSLFRAIRARTRVVRIAEVPVTSNQKR